MKNLLNNKLFIVLVFPLSVYYMVTTAYQYYLEHKALKLVILKNESFFKALMTLGFSGHEYLPSVFYTILKVDNTLSEGEVQDIAQKQIVSVVLKYAKNENLLSKINVTTTLENDEVIFELKPATCELAIQNFFNFIISMSLYVIVLAIILSTW